MKTYFIIEPEIECLRKILNIIHEHHGVDGLEGFELDSTWETAGALAMWGHDGTEHCLCDGYWFVVNCRDEIKIVSPTKIENELMEKHSDEILETLSNISNR